MPPPPPPPASSHHVHALLAEYTDTLGSLPNELTRSFSDLRELDAVLRSSIEAITRKIQTLATLIQSSSASPAERLLLMIEIADDAQRLKMGSEDKIRVAGRACEELIQTGAQTTSLLSEISTSVPAFSKSINVRNTTYPHVAPPSLASTLYAEPGRRRRAPTGGMSLTRDRDAVASPSKRRRVADDDDPKARGPRGGIKDKVNGVDKERNAAKAQKPINAPLSPTLSLLSTASNHQLNNRQAQNSKPSNQPSSRAPAKPSSTLPPEPSDNAKSLAARGHARTATGTSSLLDVVASRSRPFDEDDYAASSNPKPNHTSGLGTYTNGNVNGSGSAATNGKHTNGSHTNGNESSHETPQKSGSGANTTSNAGTTSAKGGKTSAGSTSGKKHAAAAHVSDHDSDGGNRNANDDPQGAADGTAEVEGDIEGEDLETYCYCDRVSFGEMIACDDAACPREWFHLSCLGLSTPPKGSWFCDTCATRREKEEEKAKAAKARAAKTARGRRGKGGRGNGNGAQTKKAAAAAAAASAGGGGAKDVNGSS
ncbi:hypothetical protein BOTBODRAFT_26956 [Botryobasidium botryosum FD-172 SS1]|uniref:Uncharacterized protein n=1 Tax=Botryobasidium botryosum (strain FD-172 SS1) TaxID=930990 RepID=A0A067N9Z9_BOTB1|nr:hypothetical protein BOTBODRAFT_26956 [Botryobasidium botryosum FD-172 SS1]